MGVSDKYRRCSHTKTTKCRSRDRGLAEADVSFRRKNRKPTRSVWPQCSQTNRRVRTGRILSNYKVTVWVSLSASRAVTSELEFETKYTGREMSRAHLGWMRSASRGNNVLWLSLSTLPSRSVWKLIGSPSFPYAPYYYSHLCCVTRGESVISYGARCTKLKERFSDPCAAKSPL